MEMLFLLGALNFKNNLTLLENVTKINNEPFNELPRFWTNTGLCPPGDINHKAIRDSLLSDAMLMNFRHISALPYDAITHVRVHWLLELLEFVQFSQQGVPIYDFKDLEKFLFYLDDIELYPVIEFMGNPGDVFVKNPNRNGFLWQDLSFQIVRHFLNIMGAKKLLKWRFESWNEPDLTHYNKLNFTVDDYLIYLHGIKSGLKAAGQRSFNNLNFTLRGPAGLFKSLTKHPLCWSILHHCELDIKGCPFQILTYHRKGDGTASDLMEASSILLKNIFEQYPALANLQISNDEADPISNWAVSRDFQADVQYASTLVLIVMLHWNAKIRNNEFKNLETISHDNAFLSFYPYEFTQRTLLAHFRMNNTEPVYSQFIQKPVYAVLGLLAKLAKTSTDLQAISIPEGQVIKFLETADNSTSPFYLTWLLTTEANATGLHNFTFERDLAALNKRNMETFSYIVETLENKRSDPAHIWKTFACPPYPNSNVRELMRRHQTPIMRSIGHLNATTKDFENVKLQLNFHNLQSPWVMLIRICSNFLHTVNKVQHLVITEITKGEIFITWRETTQNYCLKTYEVWYQQSNASNWNFISKNWHLPFPSYHFAPINAQVNGFYKVRWVNIFNETSGFSEIIEYIEI